MIVLCSFIHSLNFLTLFDHGVHNLRALRVALMAYIIFYDCHNEVTFFHSQPDPPTDILRRPYVGCTFQLYSELISDNTAQQKYLAT